KGRFTISRDD
nr:immunoglobulin heavy chain junction region [Homo sapiens]